MRYRKLAYLLLLFCITLPNTQIQCITSFKINKILIIDKDNFVGDYGKRFSGIEICNFSSKTANIAGYFLTNNINDSKKYMIPKGDILTKIKPRQHILFLADNMPMCGAFHLNFALNPNKVNFIALFDSDGKTLIDSITIPIGQKENINCGSIEDRWNKKRLGNGSLVYCKMTTPTLSNKGLDIDSKIKNFKKNDSSGIGMTLTAMFIVFGGLTMLYLIFKFIGKIAISLSSLRTIRASGITKEELMNIVQPSGEIFAAIAMAIYEATEMHDEENTIITIKNTARNYSPWNSKIYTLRETPNKK